jgi:hypothetical protein
MSIILPKHVDTAIRGNRADATYTLYKSMLTKLFREKFNTDKYSVALLKDTKNVIDYLASQNVWTQKLISLALVIALRADKVDKCIIDEYGKRAREARIIDTTERIGRAATQKEAELFINWCDIIKLREEFKNELDNKSDTLTDNKYTRLFMKYVILCLFTMIPPQRGQIFYNCSFGDASTNNGRNVIDLKRKLLVIREHKTQRSYGERTLALPTKLITVLKDWYDHVGKGSILRSANNKPMSSSSFTQFMNTIFDASVSTDMLRKIYVSYMINDENIDDKERERLAYDMGHSVFQQEFTYNKGDWKVDLMDYI